MKWVSVQVSEVINGKLTPVPHKGNKDIREEISMGNIPADKLAVVKHGMGLTINLGDYQSAKVDVGIELPCHVDSINTAFNDAADFTNLKLMEEVGTLYDLKKMLGGKKG